jgi:hypothetical protein
VPLEPGQSVVAVKVAVADVAVVEAAVIELDGNAVVPVGKLKGELEDDDIL